MATQVTILVHRAHAHIYRAQAAIADFAATPGSPAADALKEALKGTLAHLQQLDGPSGDLAQLAAPALHMAEDLRLVAEQSGDRELLALHDSIAEAAEEIAIAGDPEIGKHVHETLAELRSSRIK